MGGLDSRIALALAAKAELVFSRKDQVLAYPIGGASYKAAEMNFFPLNPTAETKRATLMSLSAFSAFANVIPTGRIWSAISTTDLAAVYRRVLEVAEVAETHDNPAVLEKLRLARKVLFMEAADGTLVDSKEYAAYKGYRDAYFLAKQQYDAAQASVENGGDAASHAEWLAKEPALRINLDDAELVWAMKGHRKEVEEAQAILSTLSKDAAITTWHRWEQDSRQGVGTMADLTGAQFWPTYISPANACEVGWQRMVLNKGEVQALQDKAPKDLKLRLGNDVAPLEVEQLEFEYTSAKLQRPWFDGDLFRSRFWRSPTGDEIRISTGKEPFAGDCPLYASGVVFFRRVRATVKGDAEEVKEKLGDDDFELLLLRLKRDSLKLKTVKPPIPIVNPSGSNPHIPPTWNPGNGGFGNHGPLVLPGHPGGGLGPGSLLAGNFGGAGGHGALGGQHHFAPQLFVAAPVGGGVADVTLTPQVDEEAGTLSDDPKTQFNLEDLLRHRLILRDQLWKPPPAPAITPAKAGTTVMETADDEIFILALICSLVPRSPNPDPSLDW